MSLTLAALYVDDDRVANTYKVMVAAEAAGAIVQEQGAVLITSTTAIMVTGGWGAVHL